LFLLFAKPIKKCSHHWSLQSYLCLFYKLACQFEILTFSKETSGNLIHFFEGDSNIKFSIDKNFYNIVFFSIVLFTFGLFFSNFGPDRSNVGNELEVSLVTWFYHTDIQIESSVHSGTWLPKRGKLASSRDVVFGSLFLEYWRFVASVLHNKFI